jgi:hypothetical protein
MLRPREDQRKLEAVPFRGILIDADQNRNIGAAAV